MNNAAYNSNITILIDVDDVLIDLFGAWCYSLNTTYCLNVNPNEITDWNIEKAFPTLNKSQIFSPLFHREFWKFVKAKKNAVISVKTLIDNGYDVYLCTSTHWRTVYDKFSCAVFELFPFIPWEKVIITFNKQMIKADILIDDNVNNLVDGEYKKILMDMPHNRAYDAEANGMIRAHNWKEIMDTIYSCQQERDV